MGNTLRFSDFSLNQTNRQLHKGDKRIDLNARYMDALILLVSNQGSLISKQVFLEKVWADLVVSDEAITQCIKTLRKILGDKANKPQFIETVPKYGYRFIADVSSNELKEQGIDKSFTPVNNQAINSSPQASLINIQNKRIRLFTGGVSGAAVCGLGGGICYSAFFVNSLHSGLGNISILFVLITICLLLALLGGTAISLAVTATQKHSSALVVVASTISGGLLGGLFSIFSTDTMQLLFGQGALNVTGAMEGAILGSAVALAFLFLKQNSQFKDITFWQACVVALIGVCAGLLVSLSGGLLFTGSLATVANTFPDSPLNQVTFFSSMGQSIFMLYLCNTIETCWFTACISLGLFIGNR